MIDTHSIPLLHRETDGVTHHSSPSLVIRAEGPSFQLPRANPGEGSPNVGYSNVASCIDIQVDANKTTIAEQLVKVTIYAR